jgi:hypothetical protein
MLSRPMSRLLGVAAITASLALAACGGNDDADTSARTTAPSATSDTSAAGETARPQENSSGAEATGNSGSGTDIKVADSQYGAVLFGGADRAIYLG